MEEKNESYFIFHECSIYVYKQGCNGIKQHNLLLYEDVGSLETMEVLSNTSY